MDTYFVVMVMCFFFCCCFLFVCFVLFLFFFVFFFLGGGGGCGVLGVLFYLSSGNCMPQSMHLFKTPYLPDLIILFSKKFLLWTNIVSKK